VLALLAVLAAVAAPLPPAARAAPTAFVWPASGTITSPFGNDSGRWHPGIDIGVLRSPTVRAAASGRVVRVGTPRGFEGYGNVVAIDVGGGYTTLYAHLSRWRARVGQEVEAGRPIAVAGCTGWCTGTHLHFEVRYRGKAVNPMRFAFRPYPSHGRIETGGGFSRTSR
jgi:murein DD-endopeptidase MepM/ murein hydrolase activator NlpD